MGRNFIDKAVEFVSPKRALQRYQARAVLQVVNKRFDKMVESEQRKYDGASKGRHYSDWNDADLSVNQEIQHALSTLRKRSRDLCRNNAYAINAVRALRNNVVGTGIVPTPSGTGLGKNQLKALKAAWKKWAGKTMCDYDDMNTFSGLQSLVMRVVAESGECLARRVRAGSDEYLPLRIQLLEGDYIDSNRHSAGVWSKDNTIDYYGVRFDKKGRRLGYWLYKQHPNEYGYESELVSADDVVHVYEVERPGQIRGVPLSCGVMLRLKDLEDYEFTERIRNKVAAAFSVFVTDGTGTDNPKPEGVDDLERIEPGMIKTLLPGQHIEVATPPTTQGFGDFVKANLRGVAAGWGTSYEALTNDYSNVNFSSGRMGWIEFNRTVEHFQWLMMIPRFCDKVFPWFVQACQLKGVIPLTADVDASWTPPRREMIDPLKEIQALREGIRAGLYSWQDVVRMYGYIPDELLEELKQDKEMWDKLELKPTSDPRFDSNRPTDIPDQPPADDGSSD